MRFLVLVLVTSFALSGCKNQYEITGTNASGTEIFKGSALGFQAGKFNIESNKNRKCNGRFDSVNDLASGYGKGDFKCTDGNEGTFWFNIEKNYKSGNGAAYIGGEKFKFIYGKQT
ncbi:hypothetical protein [Roseibium marinum]|uniref:Lipoprotein n=1 Tax=Roseibium marinum TaxID=281252 RepID=A0A2S3V2P6_9HYPH|nr:hypothetical protein [Roseibium marinum]POF34257.1 hypothetical protein CLV41_101711 [Roseibium marinum]